MKTPKKNKHHQQQITKKDNIKHMTQTQKKKNNKTTKQIQIHHIELKMICVI